MTTNERGARSAERGAQNRRLVFLLIAAALGASAGCRQRMADQPYYRPLEYAEFYKTSDHGRSSRPLERGTIHRAQRLETDPIATGLTAEEWVLSYKFAVPASPDATGKFENKTLTEAERRERAIGAPRYDQRVAGQPKVYVEEFPFPITQADLKRGQDRYTIFCAVCHGPQGNGQGKIWERGYLHPTSFHTHKVDAKEVTVSNPQGLGISRGYSLWFDQNQKPMPMDEVPVGYIFEVITKGYGGMPSYSAQIKADDRWRIIAYIRVLQMTQGGNVTPDVKKLLDAAGGKQ